MAVDPKKALIKNRVAIVRDLDNGDDVADYLYANKLFTEDMRDSVLVSIHSLEGFRMSFSYMYLNITILLQSWWYTVMTLFIYPVVKLTSNILMIQLNLGESE